MKKSTLLTFVFNCSFILLVTLSPSCSTELASPEELSIENLKINSRTDFSGYESQVRVKVAERENISQSAILTCDYEGTNAQGHGIYKFTTSVPSFGTYTVTGIIGDDIEGW